MVQTIKLSIKGEMSRWRTDRRNCEVKNKIPSSEVKVKLKWLDIEEGK